MLPRDGSGSGGHVSDTDDVTSNSFCDCAYRLPFICTSLLSLRNPLALEVTVYQAPIDDVCLYQLLTITLPSLHAAEEKTVFVIWPEEEQVSSTKVERKVTVTVSLLVAIVDPPATESQRVCPHDVVIL